VGSDWHREARAYRSSRRETQARRTRQRVLDAATAVFLEHGFAGATMRAIASRAGLSVPTVELLFGTKGRLLKAAIDVAIVGDDEPVPVLARSWAEAAMKADDVQEFLATVAGVIGSAQQRSAGLVLAVFEATSADADLVSLAARLSAQRATSAAWIVEQLTRKAALRADCTSQEAIDTVWILMEPALFDRLIRQRRWTLQQYQRWLASSIGWLLLGGTMSPDPTTIARRCST
jgi:AcrR family transcriptional regulator